MLLKDLPTEEIEARLIAGRLARLKLLRFAQLNAPDPAESWNIAKSKYQWKKHHVVICDALEQLEAGAIKALEIEMSPRMGKTEMAVRNFVCWHAGKHPDRDLIVITATAELATEHGRDVRDYMNGAGYKLTFGKDKRATLRDDSQSANRLQLVGGAKIHFYGRGQIPAGVGGFGIVFDDFFKSAEEANSPTERDNAWRSYSADCLSRLNNADAWVLIIGSRKHQDDVQGRLFDPTNVHYDANGAAKFKRIRIPALSEGEGDPLGRPVDEVCWPERFPREFYLAKRNHTSAIVRVDFQTQDQCHPTPEEGNYFKKEWLKPYLPNDLPKLLKHYSSSDHAVRKEQKNDKQCILRVGVDSQGVIWILPVIFWERADTYELSEALLTMFKEHRPITHWAGKDHISGSIGPFLKRRMLEEKIFVVIQEITEKKDIEQRAQSIKGRFSQGMVRCPVFAPWWARFETELLSFPSATHDDGIAALAHVGMELDRMVSAQGQAVSHRPADGSWDWHQGARDLTMQDKAALAARW